MTEFTFKCLDVSYEQYAVSPSLVYRLRVEVPEGQRIQAIALRCQIRIEPQRRPYESEEAQRLLELFGERGRWGDTLKPFQFANASTVVPSFTGSTEVDVTVPCSYDMEVSTGRYFHALSEGEVPFLLMFSGTVFGNAEKGLWIEQVPWHAECRYRMPVSVWQEMMDAHFPGCGWLMLRRETISALAEFRAGRALPTWDDAVLAVLDEAKQRQSDSYGGGS